MSSPPYSDSDGIMFMRCPSTAFISSFVHLFFWTELVTVEILWYLMNSFSSLSETYEEYFSDVTIIDIGIAIF